MQELCTLRFACLIIGEPVHNEPVHDEPVHDEPVHHEPVHDEPVHNELVRSVTNRSSCVVAHSLAMLQPRLNARISC